MDEVFGSGNFVSLIAFQTTSGFDAVTLARQCDYLLWYAKNIESVKYRQLYEKQQIKPGEGNARWVLLKDGSYRGVSSDERMGLVPLPEEVRLYMPDNIISQGAASTPQPFEFDGKVYKPGADSHWKAKK